MNWKQFIETLDNIDNIETPDLVAIDRIFKETYDETPVAVIKSMFAVSHPDEKFIQQLNRVYKILEILYDREALSPILIDLRKVIKATYKPSVWRRSTLSHNFNIPIVCKDNFTDGDNFPRDDGYTKKLTMEEFYEGCAQIAEDRKKFLEEEKKKDIDL